MKYYSAMPHTLLSYSATVAVIRVKGNNISKSLANISTRPKSQIWLVPNLMIPENKSSKLRVHLFSPKVRMLLRGQNKG